MTENQGPPQTPSEELPLGQLQDYARRVNEFPLLPDEREKHMGEYFARSLDGSVIFGFGRTVEVLANVIRKQHGKRLSEVVIGVVQSADESA